MKLDQAMPILYEFFKTHCHHHEYLTEITICEDSNCEVCAKLARSIRTPKTKDGLLRDTILRPMGRPVADKGNVGHFVPPNKTRAAILEKKMSFEHFKAGLPPLDKRPFDSELVKKNEKADASAVQNYSKMKSY